MVLLLFRALDRLLAPLLLLALALAGAAVAVFSIQGGTAFLSLHNLAALVRLPELRDTVGSWLAALEAPGPVAIVALLSGIGAVLLGLGLLAGLLVPRRERVVVLAQEGEDVVGARRRSLAQVLGALAGQVPGVTKVRATVKPRRTTGAKAAVRAARVRPTEPGAVSDAVERALQPVTSRFPVTAKVRTRLPRGAARVQ